MSNISDKELCLRKIHTHLVADPPRISAAMITIQKYGEQLGIRTEILEFTQDTPLSDERLDLSARQLNALDMNGITFLGQLLSVKLSLLEAIPHLERPKIFAKLERSGLRLGMELPKTAKHHTGEFKLPCWSNVVLEDNKPGWYWIKPSSSRNPNACHICWLEKGDVKRLVRQGCLFSGPIPQPQN